MKEKFLTEFRRLLIILTFADREKEWKRMVYELYLQRDKAEKIDYLKKDLKASIARVSELSEQTLYEMIVTDKGIPNSEVNLTERYTDIFCNDYFQKPESKYQFEQLIESAVEENPKIGFGFDYTQSVIYTKREEILQLPKMGTFLRTLSYLYHIDLIYKNLDAVKNNMAIVKPMTVESYIHITIKGFFNAMDKNIGWERAFYSENDFETYSDLLTQFFEHKKYEIPTEIIKLLPNSKTKVATALGNIYRKFEENMRRNKEFYKLIKVLSPFENSTEDAIYNGLKR